MSESTPETTPQAKRQKKHILCYVHEKAQNHDLVRVNKFVCRKLKTTKHTDGKYYCLLHLPTTQKNINEFNKLIESRIEEVDKKVAKIETDFPNDEEMQNKAKNKWELFYDFSYVWFPKPISFLDKTFKDYVYFSSATFCGYADFRSAKFERDTYFNDISFKDSALFMSSKFFGNTIFENSTFHRLCNFESAVFNNVYLNNIQFGLNDSKSNKLNECLFRKATFNKSVIFDKTNFTYKANYEEAQFLGKTSFNNSIFESQVTFESAKFEDETRFEKAKFVKPITATDDDKIYFKKVRFAKDTYFRGAEFHWRVTFNSAVFGEDSDVIFRETLFAKKVSFYYVTVEGYLRFIKLKQEAENWFDFQEVAFERSKRISFHTVRLRPSWFVNVDSRRFVFTDISWENIDSNFQNQNMNLEIESLKNRPYINNQGNHLLEIATRQLAVNAEENNRVEEAKQFRELSIALKKYPCFVVDGLNETDKNEIRLSICNNYPVVNEDGGQYYCIWHYPNKNKAESFLKEFYKSILKKEQDYRYAVFPIDIFLSDGQPKTLNFEGARFQRKLTFHGARVHYLNLSQTKFEKEAELNFSESSFNDKVDLKNAIFEGRFNVSDFNNYTLFMYNGSLSMNDARFDKPNWITFRNVRLLPEYFFDVDSSKFTFHDCKWNEHNDNRLALDKTKDYQFHKDYAQTCNHLAINY